ncbi:MAG: helix-turn-helix domain-containing protein [Lentisphaeria bacterium]|nr:helix-turn-helix domain-containing protein [Lentisphaeria bacterium]
MLPEHEIFETLRRGVQKIISRATPPCGQELCGKYQRSSHPSREFLFVIQGGGAYLCNDSVYPCSPGTLFLFDSGLPHGHQYTKEDNNLVHLWGYFHGRNMHQTIYEVTQNGQARNVINMSCIMMPEYIVDLIENRWNLLARLENVTEKKVEDYLKAPINAALDEIAFRVEERADELSPKTPIKDMENYIRSRNGRECSLEHLAAIFGYTRGDLAHKFRNETGMTIGTYINRIRLDYIRSAKKQGIRQKEMAYELGFSTPTAFWNWFRKYRDQV